MRKGIRIICVGAFAAAAARGATPGVFPPPVKETTGTGTGMEITTIVGPAIYQQFSDETSEINESGSLGKAAVVKYTMPPYWNTIVGMRVYACAPGYWYAVVYNADRQNVYEGDIFKAETGWQDMQFSPSGFVVIEEGQTFYVGVKWKEAPAVARPAPHLVYDAARDDFIDNSSPVLQEWPQPVLGVDTTPPGHPGNMWIVSNGNWSQADEACNFMIGVIADRPPRFGHPRRFKIVNGFLKYE